MQLHNLWTTISWMKITSLRTLLDIYSSSSFFSFECLKLFWLFVWNSFSLQIVDFAKTIFIIILLLCNAQVKLMQQRYALYLQKWHGYCIQLVSICEKEKTEVLLGYIKLKMMIVYSSFHFHVTQQKLQREKKIE